MVQLQGIWCCEVAEMSALDRSEVRKIKSFLSSPVDRYRPPYGRKPQNFPRQMIFCGTINAEGGYLRDATGGRRFWPITCTKINLDGLTSDRDQLWAEAVVRFKAGASWWLDNEKIEATAGKEAEERYSGDVRDEIISKFISGKPSVSVAEILDECLGSHEKIKWTQADQNMVSRALIALGWTRKREATGTREWRYRPPSQSVPVDFKTYKENINRNKKANTDDGDNINPQTIYTAGVGRTGTTGTTGTDPDEGGWTGSI